MKIVKLINIYYKLLHFNNTLLFNINDYIILEAKNQATYL